MSRLSPRGPLAAMLLLVLLAPALARGQGTLEGLRREVRDEEPELPAPPAADKDDADECDQDGEKCRPWDGKDGTKFWDYHRCQQDREEQQKKRQAEEDDGLASGFFNAAFQGALIVAAVPFLGPQTLLEGGEAAPPYFASRPYCSAPGAMGHDTDGSPELPPGGRFWNRQVQLEYGDDFDGLTRGGGRVLVEYISRWGFDLTAVGWNESLPGGADDQLWTGDANLLYRFAQNERVQLRSGIGLNWLADSAGGDVGFNFTYGGDFYPCRPLVFSSEFDVGRLGDAWLSHVRATAGIVWQGAEFYVGYDYLHVGTVELDGLVTGLRFSF